MWRGVTPGLNAFRSFRLLRLAKLARLLRGMRIVKRYQTHVSISHGTVILSRCLLQLLVVAHWESCLWGLQTTFAASPLDTWLGSYGFCVPAEEVVLFYHTECSEHVCCVGGWSKYLAALYWATATSA